MSLFIVQVFISTHFYVVGIVTIIGLVLFLVIVHTHDTWWFCSTNHGIVKLNK